MLSSAVPHNLKETWAKFYLVCRVSKERFFIYYYPYQSTIIDLYNIYYLISNVAWWLYKAGPDNILLDILLHTSG